MDEKQFISELRSLTTNFTATKKEWDTYVDKSIYENGGYDSAKIRSYDERAEELRAGIVSLCENYFAGEKK